MKPFYQIVDWKDSQGFARFLANWSVHRRRARKRVKSFLTKGVSLVWL